MNENQFRQGDILIEKFDGEVPETAVPKTPEAGRYMLAYGEITGHHHSLAVEDVEWMKEDADGTLYLMPKAQTGVEHQEHGTIPIKRQVYKVTKQREYHRGEVRNVLD
jgi:hypothetical protein